MPRDENGDLLVYDPMSWRAILGGILVAVCAWMATRALVHAERVVTGNTNYGYVADPVGTRQFLSELDQPNFRQAGAEAVEKAKGVDTFLYRAADKASRAVYGKPFAPWNQGNAGTCVGNAWAMGSWIGQSVSWAAGELPAPPKMVSVEAVYGGSRTFGRLPPVLSGAGYSDGSYGAAAARWVAGRCKDPTVGGILYREKYGNVDLSHYSIPLCREWGNSGPPLELARLAHEHTATAVALINDYGSLIASLESGFPVAICSNVGYAATNVRDSMGYLPRGGQWNHAMVAVACRHAATSGRDGVLILNSWGNFCSGPKWPPDQPDGSFWISKADATSMIAQSDSFAIGSVGGFKYRDLHNGNWMEAK
jgi:hypothetical protein